MDASATAAHSSQTPLPDIEPDDDDDDDDDDEEDTGQFVDAATAHPRPPVRGNWRYKKGDVMMFRKPFFMEDYDGAVVGGLEAPAMLRRDRTGVIFGRTRQRPRARQKGAFLYTVVFDDPSTKVPRLPAHGDDGIDDDENVEFLNDAAA